MKIHSCIQTFLFTVVLFLAIHQVFAIDDVHLSLVEDGAGLFNERGYMKSNSYSLDGNEVINDFNGNLIYTQGLRYLPITQNGVHGELRISYNGSVGHIANSSLGSKGGQFSHQQNINLPEWIISINNVAIQTFNFENELISWETVSLGDSTSLDDDVAALTTGYHSSYIHTPGGETVSHGTISILMGDGSVKQFQSSDTAIMTSKGIYAGEYLTFSKDDRSRGYLDTVTSNFTMFLEDGIIVKFKYYTPEWKHNVDSWFSEAEQPQIFLPVSFEDRFGTKLFVEYDSTVSVGGQPQKISGRPVVSNACGYVFDWGGFLSGSVGSYLLLREGGQFAEYAITFAKPLFGGGPALTGDGISRSYVTTIQDLMGRITTFEYDFYKRFVDNFGPVDFEYPLFKMSGSQILLYPLRISEITNPYGGTVYYSYYNDPRTEWQGSGNGIDSMGLDLTIECSSDSQYPCRKTPAFDSLGRDPFFTNMIVSKTKEKDGVIVSRDSLHFSWEDNDLPSHYITTNDEFYTVRYTDSTEEIFNDVPAQKIEFEYRQYPEPGVYSRLVRDRGWSLKLVNQGNFEIDVEGVLVKVSEKTQVWDVGTCSGYCNGTQLLTELTTYTNDIPFVEQFSYMFYGDSTDVTVNNLLKKSTKNSWGQLSETYFDSQYFLISSDSAYYTNVLVDSVLNKQIDIENDTIIVSKLYNEFYVDSDSAGFPGQISRSTDYIISGGSIVDSISEYFEYLRYDYWRQIDRGALRKKVNPVGDSIVYHYQEKDKTPIGYDNKGQLDSLFCPVLCFEAVRDGSTDTLSKRFDNNGPFWWKSEHFLSKNFKYQYDTAFDTTYAGDTLTLTAVAPYQGEDSESVIIEVGQTIQYNLILPSEANGCEDPSWAKILKNNVIIDQIFCTSSQQNVVNDFSAQIGDTIEVNVKHASSHGGTYLAKFDYVGPDTSVDTIIVIDTIPDAIISYQNVDKEGKLKEYVDPHSYISNVYYDYIDRVKRIVLPGSFASNDYLELRDTSIISYPGHDGESVNWVESYVGIGPLANCNFDTLRVLDTSVSCSNCNPDPHNCCPGYSAYFSFEGIDLSLIDTTYLDSAFLTLYCVRNDGVLDNAYPAVYHDVPASCNGPIPNMYATLSPYTIPDTGYYRLDIKDIVHWWLEEEVPQPVQSLALLPFNWGETTELVFYSNDYFDMSKRPKLEIYYRYWTEEDSVYTALYQYDDDTSDGDLTSTTILIKADTTRFSKSSRIRFDGFSKVFQSDALDSLSTYDSTVTKYDFADRAVATFDQLEYETKKRFEVDTNDKRKELTVFPDSAGSTKITKYTKSGIAATGLDSIAIYNDSNLFVTISFNENGDSTKEFRDILKQLRLSQRFKSGTALNTYSNYDLYGNLSLVIKPEGDSVRYWYNSLGWLEKEWSADCDTIKYRHDKLGNVILKQHGNLAALDIGDTTNWIYNEYDAISRLTESGTIVFDDTVTLSQSPNIRNFYDQTSVSTNSNGRLSVSFKNDSGLYKYGEKYDYDFRGRLIKQINFFEAVLDSIPIDSSAGVYEYFPVGDSFVISYTYDMADRVTSMTYPDGMVVTYSYDERGRLKSVGDDTLSTKYASLNYTVRDQIETMILGDSAQVVDYDYNERGWLSSINDGATSGTDKFGQKLFYYGDSLLPAPSEVYYNGNIMGQRLAIEGKSTARRRYLYDELDRLEEVRIRPTSQFLWEERYWYDDNGNILRYIRDSGAFIKDTLDYLYIPETNQLDSVDGTFSGGYQSKYDYDENSNLVFDQKKGLTYKYDFLDQLRAVIMNHSTIPDDTVRFGYSVSGERVYKHYRHFWEDDCPPDTEIELESMQMPGQSFEYYNDPMQFEEFGVIDTGGSEANGPGGGTCLYYSSAATYFVRSKGKVLAEYTTLYTSQPNFKYIYAGDQRIALRKVPGDLHFYLNDHLGSATVVVDSTGQRTDYSRYRAYGNIYEAQVNTGQKFSYTGQPLDEEVGMDLYYYGARYYDAFLGRFISKDPLAEKYQSWSPYNYTLANPVKFIDPDGQKVEYAPGASSQFKQDFGKAIQYLNKNKVSGTIADLQKSSETVFVGPAGGSDPQYNASTNTILWDPNIGAVLSSGGTMSPSLILLHEAAHALSDVTDPKAHAERRAEPDPQYGNKEEKRVTETVETPAAKKAGEGTRTDREATLVPVSDPTQRPPEKKTPPPQPVNP